MKGIASTVIEINRKWSLDKEGLRQLLTRTELFTRTQVVQGRSIAKIQLTKKNIVDKLKNNVTEGPKWMSIQSVSKGPAATNMNKKIQD